MVIGHDGVSRPSLSALLTFESVSRHLSFRQAASELRVTPTAISRTIRLLEEQLDARLFNRTTRSVALTEVGMELLESLTPALDQITASVQQIGQNANSAKGILRLNTSYVAYICLLYPYLPEFLGRYPDLVVDVTLDDRLVDIVGSGFDAGIRLGHSVQRDMIGVPLGGEQQTVVVGSPEYLEKFGAPSTPEQLHEHRCIRQQIAGSGRAFDWQFGPRSSPFTVRIEGNLIFSEMRSVLDAAKAGVGLAYVYRRFAETALASGEVVPLLEEHCAPTAPFYVYYPHRSRTPAKLRVFVEFMREKHGLIGLQISRPSSQS